MDKAGIADELFALPPGQFIAQRDALANDARDAGHEELSQNIKALRRPTVGAALLNALVRERGDSVNDFLELGPKLRKAEADGNGEDLRALMRSRQRLMAVLDKHTAELAKDRGLTATTAVLRDIHTTMLVALTDADADQLVRGGRLQTALVEGPFIAADDSARPVLTSRSEPAAKTSAAARRVESAQRKLDEAAASLATAEADVTRQAEAVAVAQSKLTSLQGELDEMLKQARVIERSIATTERELAATTDSHEDAVRRATTVRAAAAKAKAAYDHERSQ